MSSRQSLRFLSRGRGAIMWPTVQAAGAHDLIFPLYLLVWFSRANAFKRRDVETFGYRS